MDSCEKISNSITAAKELIENETRSLAALHKAKQLEKELPFKEAGLNVVFTKDHHHIRKEGLESLTVLIHHLYWLHSLPAMIT